jgi:peroxiredoxin
MKKLSKILLLGIITSLALGLVVTGCVHTAKTATIGSKAPDFTLNDLEGSSIALRGYKGTPVLLNFWKIDCPYCIEEMPLLQAVQDERQGEVVLITINIADSASAAKDFLAQNGYSFTVLLDTDHKATNDYGLVGTPTSFLIDADGIIKDKIIGPFANKKDLDSRLAAILP